MGISKITRNYQVTLPRDIRKIVGLKEGDEVIITIENNSIKISKLNDDIISRTAGIWKDMKETGEEYQRRIRKGWSRRMKRLYGDTGY
ncbi:AbrB/MazE/SpoVT family DNA-binding domain-containing protein [Candidatus Pacearchaeota archaeon]|nr:AbrB/MazE/SpoVT family DNA-binding domain-containing protein [Candidatus Pacearchaeota archaeon]